MLEKLVIDNVAVIEHAEVDFVSGLNVLTGETGAGKSIVIDSINLVLGMRSNRELIRTGAKTASVTAVFSALPETNRTDILSPDEDGKIILERAVSVDGRGAARINGKIVSVSQLKEIGEILAGIHGQHDNGSLLNPEMHVDFLDEYADDEVILVAYKEDYQQLRKLAERIRSLKTESRDRQRRLELLKYQVAEIDDAALGETEEETLLEARKRIRNGEKINEALNIASSCLSGEENGAEQLLKKAAEALSHIENVSKETGSIKERIMSAAYEINDCLSEIRAVLDGNGLSDVDPAQVEARLDVIHRLKSKYGADYAEIMRYRENAAAELAEYEDTDGLIASLTEEYTKLREETLIYADKLSEMRRKAAEVLCAAVKNELEFLNMPGSEFFAQVTEAESLLPNGGDVVEFMLSANRGEEPRPLAKIASGGELSRIMLAIKNALSEREGVPTQIFDEIDTGVSGKAAGRIGIKLKQISKGRQILCVTHLSQIAAFADRHLLIEKGEQNGRTYTAITPLDRDRRINELARIMSGDAAGEAARIGAEELLKYAEEYKV